MIKNWAKDLECKGLTPKLHSQPFSYGHNWQSVDGEFQRELLGCQDELTEVFQGSGGDTLSGHTRPKLEKLHPNSFEENEVLHK